MLLSPTVVLEGRQSVRAVRRQGRLVLAGALAAYVWLVSVVGRPWSDTTLIAALALVPVFGVLGVMLTAKLAGAKARLLGLVCPACDALLVDARGSVTVRDQHCGACGQLVLAPTDVTVPTTRQLTTRQEFIRRADEWRTRRDDNMDTVKLVGAPCLVIGVFVEFVVGGFGEAPPDWMRVVEGVLVVVFFGLYFVLETRLARLGHRLELYCDCGAFLPQPGGPNPRQGFVAAVRELETTMKVGTCWHCGRRVWQAETTS